MRIALLKRSESRTSVAFQSRIFPGKRGDRPRASERTNERDSSMKLLPQLIGHASELLPGTAISADHEKEQERDRCVYISVYSLGVRDGAFDEIDSFELFNGIYTRELLHPVDPACPLCSARLRLQGETPTAESEREQSNGSLERRIDYARSNAQTIFVKTATRAIIFVGSVAYLNCSLRLLYIGLLARDLRGERRRERAISNSGGNSRFANRAVLIK